MAVQFGILLDGVRLLLGSAAVASCGGPSVALRGWGCVVLLLDRAMEVDLCPAHDRLDLTLICCGILLFSALDIRLL